MTHPVTLANGDRLLTHASAKGTSAVIGAESLTQCQELGVYVVFNETAMGGSVVVETAPDGEFSGKWAELATIDWVGPHRCHYVSIAGAHRVVRVRLALAVPTGAVDVYAVGN